MNAEALSNQGKVPITGTKLRTQTRLWVLQARVKQREPSPGVATRETHGVSSLPLPLQLLGSLESLSSIHHPLPKPGPQAETVFACGMDSV